MTLPVTPLLRFSLAAWAGVGDVLVPAAGDLVAQHPTIRDSADVRIVANAARVSAPVAYRLGPPLLDVGGLESDPDVEFHHDQGYLRGVRLSDGGLAVIDVARVHYFDARGKRLRIVGRAGQGAKEFLYLTAICRTHGDTIVVNDEYNRRLAVLDRAGTIVRTIARRDLGSPSDDFCFDDGSFVLQRSAVAPTAVAGPKRLTRLRTDGSVVDVLGEFPSQGFDLVSQFDAAIVAAGERLYYGDGWPSELKIYSSAGRLLSIVRSADPERRITEADVDRRLGSMVFPGMTPSQRAAQISRIRARRRTSPVRTTWPAYAGVHVDAAGGLWIQDYRLSYPAPDVWTAFDRTGRLVGRLVLPIPEKDGLPLEVIGFGAGDVLVRRRDADGASHLTVYRIVRTERAR